MFDPQMHLLLTLLVAVSSEDGSGDAVSWEQAHAAMEQCGDVEDDVRAAVDSRDAGTLRAIIEEWFSGKRHLPEHDRAVLKRAMKAYRKSLKVTLLAAESSLGGGPMSSGRKSTILGIRPPDRYPTSVWDELVRQGRLQGGAQGLYELPPE